MQHKTLRVPRAFLSQAQRLGLTKRELREFIRTCARPLRLAFRKNSLKAASDLLLRLSAEGWAVSPVPWCADGYFVRNSGARTSSLGLSRPHIVGEIYIQEATSMLPVEALRAALATTDSRWCSMASAPLDGFKVLDLCAAPGSKTTQLAMLLSNKGLIVASDIDYGRAKRLRTNLLRCGVTNAVVTVLDGRSLGHLAPLAFDAVLVDAPCSGEGTMRKHPQVLERWKTSGHECHVRSMAKTQWELLISGWNALRPGGYLVYSTCTLNSLENEGTCHRFLKETPAASAFDLGALMNLPEAATEDGFLRIWPHTFDTEGFFVACFHKPISHDGCTPPRLSAQPSLSPEFIELGSAEVRKLHQSIMAELGFLPTGAGFLAEGSSGQIWLLPALTDKFDHVTPHALEPGIRVGQCSGRGQFCWDDEFIFCAGDRASKFTAHYTPEDWANLEVRVCPSVSAFNTVMALVASRGDASGVQKLFKDMCTSCLRPNEITYTTMISAYAQRNDIRNAELCFSEMKKLRLHIGLTTYNVLLNAYGKRSATETMDTLFREMNSQAINPDLTSKNILIHSKRGDPMAIRSAITEMCRQSIEPDIISFNSLLHGYAQRGDTKAAETALVSMQRQALKPDVVSYTTLIKAFSVKGDVKEAQRVLNAMRQHHITPGTASYNSVLNAYASAGNVSSAESLLEEMKSNCVEPDVVTFTTLMKAYAKTGDAIQVERVFTHIRQAGITPTSATYGVLLSAYARKGDVSSAARAFAGISVDGLKPNLQHHTSMIHAHVVRNDFMGASEAFLEIRKASLRPNTACYNALLQALRRARDYHGYGSLLDEIRQGGHSLPKRRMPTSQRLIAESDEERILQKCAPSMLCHALETMLCPPTALQ